MKLLALDTSNRPLSVAVMDDQQLLVTTTTNVQRGHSSDLLPIIEDSIQRAHLQPEDIDRLVVAQGPGSYTGLRIGVTTAKTYAVSLHKELVGISSLQVLAGNITQPEQLVVPLMDARRGNVYTGLYRIGQDGLPVVVEQDRHVVLQDWLKEVAAQAESVIFVGLDAEKFTDQITKNPNFKLSLPQQNLPQANILGLLGLNAHPIEKVDQFVPNYLRLTQAESEWLAKHPKEDHAPYVEKI